MDDLDSVSILLEPPNPDPSGQMIRMQTFEFLNWVSEYRMITQTGKATKATAIEQSDLRRCSWINSCGTQTEISQRNSATDPIYWPKNDVNTQTTLRRVRDFACSAKVSCRSASTDTVSLVKGTDACCGTHNLRLVDRSVNTNPKKNNTPKKQSGIALPFQRTPIPASIPTASSRPLPYNGAKVSLNVNKEKRRVSCDGKKVDIYTQTNESPSLHQFQSDLKIVHSHLKRLKNLFRAVYDKHPTNLIRFTGKYLNHIAQLTKNVHAKDHSVAKAQDGPEVLQEFQNSPFWNLTKQPYGALPDGACDIDRSNVRPSKRSNSSSKEFKSSAASNNGDSSAEDRRSSAKRRRLEIEESCSKGSEQTESAVAGDRILPLAYSSPLPSEKSPRSQNDKSPSPSERSRSKARTSSSSTSRSRTSKSSSHRARSPRSRSLSQGNEFPFSPSHRSMSSSKPSLKRHLSRSPISFESSAKTNKHDKGACEARKNLCSKKFSPAREQQSLKLKSKQSSLDPRLHRRKSYQPAVNTTQLASVTKRSPSAIVISDNIDSAANCVVAAAQANADKKTSDLEREIQINKELLKLLDPKNPGTKISPSESDVIKTADLLLIKQLLSDITKVSCEGKTTVESRQAGTSTGESEIQVPDPEKTKSQPCVVVSKSVSMSVPSKQANSSPKPVFSHQIQPSTASLLGKEQSITQHSTGTSTGSWGKGKSVPFCPTGPNARLQGKMPDSQFSSGAVVTSKKDELRSIGEISKDPRCRAIKPSRFAIFTGKKDGMQVLGERKDSCMQNSKPSIARADVAERGLENSGSPCVLQNTLANDRNLETNLAGLETNESQKVPSKPFSSVTKPEQDILGEKTCATKSQRKSVLGSTVLMQSNKRGTLEMQTNKPSSSSSSEVKSFDGHEVRIIAAARDCVTNSQGESDPQTTAATKPKGSETNLKTLAESLTASKPEVNIVDKNKVKTAASGQESESSSISSAVSIVSTTPVLPEFVEVKREACDLANQTLHSSDVDKAKTKPRPPDAKFYPKASSLMSPSVAHASGHSGKSIASEEKSKKRSNTAELESAIASSLEEKNVRMKPKGSPVTASTSSEESESSKSWQGNQTKCKGNQFSRISTQITQRNSNGSFNAYHRYIHPLDVDGGVINCRSTQSYYPPRLHYPNPRRPYRNFNPQYCSPEFYDDYYWYQ